MCASFLSVCVLALSSFIRGLDGICVLYFKLNMSVTLTCVRVCLQLNEFTAGSNKFWSQLYTKLF